MNNMLVLEGTPTTSPLNMVVFARFIAVAVGLSAGMGVAIGAVIVALTILLEMAVALSE